jgi:hypothetical protein
MSDIPYPDTPQPDIPVLPEPDIPTTVPEVVPDPGEEPDLPPEPPKPSEDDVPRAVSSAELASTPVDRATSEALYRLPPSLRVTTNMAV